MPSSMAHSMFTSSLNPNAKEFVPLSVMHAGPMLSAGADSSMMFALLDLPPELLACVMSTLEPKDIWCCCKTNQQLRAAVRSARLSFSLSEAQKHLLSNPAEPQLLDQLVNAIIKYMPGMTNCNLSMLPLEAHHISCLVQGVSQVRVLDLSGCKKLQPASVTRILTALPQLECLNLQRCFQLTSACLSDVLLQVYSTSYSADDSADTSCKTLHCLALSHLNLSDWPFAAGRNTGATAAAAIMQPGSAAYPASSKTVANCPVNTHSFWSQLQHTVHKRLLRLPNDIHHCGKMVAGATDCSSLRIISLNNCSMLSVEGLVTLAVACPQLEYLMLGGSTLQVPQASTASSAAPGLAATHVPPSVGVATDADVASGLTAAERHGSDALSHLTQLLQLPTNLPWHVLNSCCQQPAAHSDACACHCSCCSGGESSEGQDPGCNKLLLVRNQPSQAALATARHQAVALAYVVAMLPRLQAIDVTFMGPGVAGWLRHAMQRLLLLKHSSQGDYSTVSKCDGSTAPAVHALGNSDSNSRVPEVWEFSCINAVHQALQLVRQHSSNASKPDQAGSCPVNPISLKTALCCAINCSTRARSTPLHLAAETGCACHVRVLLQAGSVVNARDVGGASPLFVAAEAGKAAAVAVLLEAGADALIGNSTGETPLYIAALRGHLKVVQLLVEHFSAARVDWMNGRLYGDAWTPLMAAAVANRVDVAFYLLQAAAGFHIGSATQEKRPARSSQAGVDDHPLHQTGPVNSRWLQVSAPVHKLLAAENRYGQTALHIAARKGCRELLQLLLLYGAGRVAGELLDAAGDTPLDIARRHGHHVVLREMLQRC